MGPNDRPDLAAEAYTAQASRFAAQSYHFAADAARYAAKAKRLAYVAVGAAMASGALTLGHWLAWW